MTVKNAQILWLVLMAHVVNNQLSLIELASKNIHNIQAAKQGEAEQMLVLSSMLEAGYGCSPNASQAKMWADKAQKGLQNSQ